MSSEVDKLKARFESEKKNEVDPAASKPTPSKARGKKPPPPAKHPHLANKAIRDKISKVTINQKPNTSHKPSPPPKTSSHKKATETSEDIPASSSPGVSALANVLQNSPPSSHRSSNGAPNTSPPVKQRNKQPSPRLSRKAVSMDVTEQGGGVANGKTMSTYNVVTKIRTQEASSLSNSCGHLNTPAERGSKVSPEHNALSEHYLEKSHSLPRSPPHQAERFKEDLSSAKVNSSPDISKKSPTRRRAPPPPTQKPAPAKQKPALLAKPKPSLPPKPPSLSNLKDNNKFSQRQSASPSNSRENTPDPDAKNRSSTHSAEEEKVASNSLDETLKPSLLAAEDSWELITESQIDEIMNSPTQLKAAPLNKKKPPPTPPKVRSPGAASPSTDRRSATPQSGSVEALREKFSSPLPPTPPPTSVEAVKEGVTSPPPTSPTINIIRSNSDDTAEVRE